MSEEFDPHLGWPNQEKMGDYFHMVSTNEFASLAWAATFNEEQDIYFSIITPDIPLVSTDDLAIDANIVIEPNPFQDRLDINSALKIIHVSIFDLSGQEILKYNFDEHAAETSLNSLDHLSQGLYLIKIVFEDNSQVIKRVVKK